MSITLQINLSAGDANYGHITVERLLQVHSSEVDEILLVVDCNRPQRTHIVDPDVRFPSDIFSARVEKVRALAESLRTQGRVAQVRYLEPNDPLYSIISKKYLANLTVATHDYGACAHMAYLAALELCPTQYLLHYDADMLIYQLDGYSWIEDGLRELKNNELCTAVTPRLAPPLLDSERPTLYDWPPVEIVDNGWRDYWFSTRAFLFDIHKLSGALPLLKGFPWIRAIFRKLINRGFPVAPEVMLSHRLNRLGQYHLQLNDERSWLLHPQEKGDRFISILPSIIEDIAGGKFPESQRGIPDLDLDAWSKFCER